MSKNHQIELAEQLAKKSGCSLAGWSDTYLTIEFGTDDVKKQLLIAELKQIGWIFVEDETDGYAGLASFTRNK